MVDTSLIASPSADMSALIEMNNRGANKQKRGKLAQLISSTLLPKKSMTVFGRGVLMSDITDEIDISIPDEDRSGHFGGFGTTRVGKTRLLENIIEQDIHKGYNVVIVDPKGDTELFSKVVQATAESGRIEDLMYLSPIFPDQSVMVDPLSHYYMEDELVDHIVSGIRAKDDYFIAVATEVSAAIVSGLIHLTKSKGKKPNLNFYDIKLRSDYYSLKAFRDEISHVGGAEEVVTMMDQILNSPADFFAKVSSSLRTTLSSLTSGNTGRIIGKTTMNEFIDRFESNKTVIMYCNTGSMLARRTAHITGRVMISMIQSLVGRFFASGRKINPPLCLHIDEGHNILYRGIQELFNKGGGANVWIHFYTQSIAQIEEEVGIEAAKSILDNINTWIYFLVNHPQTAQYMEDSSPNTPKYQPVLSFGGGISVREIEDKLIKAFNVLQLNKREFYMKSYGKIYKGITMDSSERTVKVRFPNISHCD